MSLLMLKLSLCVLAVTTPGRTLNESGIHEVFDQIIQLSSSKYKYSNCRQWRRAIEALEARAPPDSIATVVNTPCPGKKVTVFSA